MEIWKDIREYEGVYQVSNFGKVKRLAYEIKNPSPKANGSILKFKEHLLTPRKVTHGYLSVILYKKGKPKNYKIHRLVAEAFIPNPDRLSEVNHKDENKMNNHIDNLEWVTHKENANYGTRPSRIGNKHSKIVKCIETDIIYPSLAKAAEQTGIDSRRISDVCTGKMTMAGGYHWEYIIERGYEVC